MTDNRRGHYKEKFGIPRWLCEFWEINKMENVPDFYNNWEEWAHKILTQEVEIKVDDEFNVKISLHVRATHTYPKDAEIETPLCDHHLVINIPLKDIPMVAWGCESPQHTLKIGKSTVDHFQIWPPPDSG